MDVDRDPPNVECPDCGNKQEMRDDWKEWIRERKEYDTNKVYHTCEVDNCNYTYEGHVDGFLKIFPFLDKRDKNGSY